MSAAEFSRLIDPRAADGRAVDLVASPAERAALARRFALIAIEALAARLVLTRAGEAVLAAGRLEGRVIQPCAISGEPFEVAIAAPLVLRFVPAGAPAPAEDALTGEEVDDIAYDGAEFDLGEAVAQSLALAIDPYAAGPNAEAARARLSDEGAVGPFAALARVSPR